MNEYIKDKGLTIIECDGSKVATGFDTWEEVEAFAERFELQPCHITKKNGQDKWHIGDNAYSAIEPEYSWYGDSYEIVRKGQYTEQEWVQQEILDLVAGGDYTHEELTAFIQSKKRILGCYCRT